MPEAARVAAMAAAATEAAAPISLSPPEPLSPVSPFSSFVLLSLLVLRQGQHQPSWRLPQEARLASWHAGRQAVFRAAPLLSYLFLSAVLHQPPSSSGSPVGSAPPVVPP